MAFKSIKKKDEVYSDIESLFRDLKTHGVESLYAHQADILRVYQKEAIEKSNVAIELPTGSGKTLIGLLIAEFRRLTKNETVVYLCPTRQLVHQVAELSNTKYGIRAIPFTGSKKNYNPQDKTSYRNSDAIAITTYSSLFNIKPFFQEPDLIIIDDSHTAENYVSSCWSLKIEREESAGLYQSIIEFIKPNIEETLYSRLLSDDIDPLDKGTANIYSNFKLYEHQSALFDLIDSAVQDTELSYSWFNIKDNLHACNLYYSWNEILIRPIIPPSYMNSSFKYANQRVFMSATLGQGGDLERITGIRDLHKIPLPSGWEKQGLGRRFILFPSLSIRETEIDELLTESINKTDRAVILVSSDKQANILDDYFEESLPTYMRFRVGDIETSKSTFTDSKSAIAILANRFDGIDFPGDDCRLLIIKDIPYTANIQERFFQQRISASLIFYDRNRTRLVQALGRCTRSPKDYAAVLVIGENDLLEWLFLESKQKYFHPELQAELKFGMENSIDVEVEDLLENLDSFFEQGESWKDAMREIIEHRSEIEKQEIVGEKALESAVNYEIKFTYSLWESDFENALQYANRVLEELSGGDELKGYRSFWKYLKSYVAHIVYLDTKEAQYKKLSKISMSDAIKMSPYFRQIDLTYKTSEPDPELDLFLEENITRLVDYLGLMKISNPRKFGNYLTELENKLSNPDSIEESQVHLGKLLGFKSIKDTTDGSPDPFWISTENFVIVFEDKIKEDEDSEIPLKDIRQAKTHQDWIRSKISDVDKKADIYTIMVTNQKKVNKSDEFACDNLYYWNYQEFLKWSNRIISLFRSQQAIYSKSDDISWRDHLIKEFKERKLAPMEIVKQLTKLKDMIYVP